MMKYQEVTEVLTQEQIAPGIFSLWLQTERIAAQAAPGQFLSVFCEDKSRILPRPISICETEHMTGRVRLVYRVAGKGTEEFSRLRPGDTLRVMGPLGNGFPLREAAGKQVLLIGGGIGIPPILQLTKDLAGICAGRTAVLGYKDTVFLKEDFLQAEARLVIATEDGSEGSRGTVLDAIREQELSADVIFACGPTSMLRALKEYAAAQNILCYLSLEERMACGVGACLACVCAGTETDAHSRVNNKRVCAEGPVFEAGEICI